MRILFITENFPPEVNASATRVHERAVYWVRAGHSVTVVTCFPNFPQGQIYPGYRQRPWRWETLGGVRVLRLPTYVARNEGFVRRTLDFVSFMIATVFAVPWLRRADVIVATSPQFFAAVAGWMASVMRRRPFVFELGDLWPASITAVGAMRQGRLIRVLERLELFLYRRSAAVVALTPAFRANLIARGIPPGKIAVVVNGVDLERYEPRLRDVELASRLELHGRFVAGYVGTHGLAHQLDNALAAAGLLRDLPDFRLLFVGDGADKPRLQALARESKQDNVLFLPPQPKESMPRIWSLCDVALVHLKDDPVFADVIPSKIFEAMAMGLPILIAAPAGEASRVVLDNSAGIWVPAARPDLLADAVRRLRSQQELRRSLAKQSRAAAARYSRKRQADDMIHVLQQVVEGRGARVGEPQA